MSQTIAPRRENLEGRVGLIAEPFAPEDIRTKTQNAKSYFGHLVIRDGANEDLIKHPDAAISDLKLIEGIVASTHAVESQRDGDAPSYPAQDSVNVLKKGYIWVAIEEDVAYGDPVHVRISAAGNEKLGAFRPSADGANTTDISSIARWTRGGLAADGIAILELNLI